MTDISFYQVMNATPASVDATLPALLEKALASGKKILVRCPSTERAFRLNESLWSYRADSFLPHGMTEDGHVENQPIFITDKVENPNGADILVVLSGAEAPDFSNYLRVLDMFEASDVQQDHARARFKEYKDKGYPLSYFANEGQGWQKKA